MNRIWRLFGLLAAVGLLSTAIWLLRRTWQQRQRVPAPQPEPARPPQAEPARPRAPQAPDNTIPDEPPPPPDPRPLALFERSREGIATTEQARRLWLALQQESYRQRAEGFRTDWAFPRYAVRHNLGVPLAYGARLQVGNTEYAFQPYARATIFNEIPHWSKVQNLSRLLDGRIPAGGLARSLLEASFSAGDISLHEGWAFHRLAVRESLGPALSESYRITVDEQEYSLQVFACDTLYCPVPHWADVRRLSKTAPGALADALWRATYQATNTPYRADAPAHQLASQEKLGAPLSDVYEIDFEGLPIQVQIFAQEAIFAAPEAPFERQSRLARPATFDDDEGPPDADDSDSFTAADALGPRRPSFAMLPVAGRPRITQFYGYTQWAAGKGRHFYTACQGRHPGIDFWIPIQTKLLAVAHGVVVYAGPTNGAPFGGSPPMIAIVRYGSVYAIYGHSSQVLVQRGQRVRPGDVVSLSGDFGGPHLHFELRPVPEHLLQNTDPQQPAVNPSCAMNPLDYFSSTLNSYFEHWFHEHGANRHFCRGSLRDQDMIWFGGDVDTRPCA
jgi:murein DD-endopeptidase MepM/ murein hydrolase activator NlpD